MAHLITRAVQTCEHLFPGGFKVCPCELIVFTDCDECGWYLGDPTGTRSAEHVYAINEHICTNSDAEPKK